MKRWAVAGLLALGVCASAYAEDARRAVLGGVVQEKDIALLFDYLRDAVGAASEGRAVVPPEALTRRAQEIGDEMKRHGAAAARALIDAMESSVREGLREPPRPAPAPPGHIRL